MTTKHMVSAELLKAATEIYDASPAEDQRRWLDQCATSAASRMAGGMVELRTDHDWKVAFLIWKLGHADKLPRETVTPWRERASV